MNNITTTTNSSSLSPHLQNQNDSIPLENPLNNLIFQAREIKEKLLSNRILLKNYSLANSEIPHLADLVEAFTDNITLERNKSEEDDLRLKNSIDPIKALVSTCLSFSAKNTGYEGAIPKHMINLYAKIFHLIQKGQGVFSKNISSELLRSIQQLQEACAKNDYAEEILSSKKSNFDEDQFVSFLISEIQNLEVGTSYTMQGGWFSLGENHSMYYRFERTSKDTFNIYLYDADGDIQKGNIKELHKKKVPPYLFFKDVTWEELFFSSPGETANPALFKNLTRINRPNKREFSKQTVLRCFFHIHHRIQEINEAHKLSLFLAVQKSGICAVKSLNCIALDLEKDHTKYKQLSFDNRLIVIIAFYQVFKSKLRNTEKGQVHLFQLKEAAMNFLRHLEANVAKSIFTEEQFSIATATIYDILQDLDTIEEDYKAQRKPELLTNPYEELEEANNRLARQSYAAGLPKEFKKAPSSQFHLSSGLSPEIGKNATWDNLQSLFVTLETILNGLKNKPEEASFQIEAFMRNISHLKNENTELIPSLNSEKAKLLAQQIFKIQENYNGAVFKLGSLSSPAILNTGMEFLALSYKLSLIADREYGILKEFGIYADYFFNFARKDKFFTILDPEIFLQRQDLETFFNKLNDGKKRIYNFENIKFSVSDFISRNMDDAAFILKYIETYPKLCTEFEEMSSKPQAFYGEQAVECFGSLENFPSSLKHLTLLKKTALLACELSGIGWEGSRNDYISIWLAKEPNNHLHVTASNSHWDTSWTKKHSIGHVTCEADYPQPFRNDFRNNPQSSHATHELIPENDLLVNQNPSKQVENLFFDLALSEPDVQTTLLLSATKNSLERLESPQFRLILRMMFTKLVVANGKLVSPFFDSLKDKNQLDKFEQLLNIGKKAFIDSLPETHPCIHEMLFLIRLYALALQAYGAAHPSVNHSNSTIQCINTLWELLMKLENLPITPDLKVEIKLAKVGLFLVCPLYLFSTEQLANFFLAYISVKNSLFSQSICSDNLFWKDCKRKFFNLEKQWSEFLQDVEKRNAFANSILKQAVNVNFELNWELQNNRLTAKDNSNESWIIDFAEAGIAKETGMLSERYTELTVTNAIKRLFQDKKYELKIFGDEIHFSDPTWGHVRIVGKDKNLIIQRQIEGKWFTYVDREFKPRNLKINAALFFDHTLWFNEENPQDLRIYNLRSGLECCKMTQGIITHSETKKTFYSPKGNPLLEKFETLEHISGWIDEKENILEFNSYRSEDKNKLTFTWDSEKENWAYSSNSDFAIDPNPILNIDFEVDKFLPLVNSDGTKRKLLVPLGQEVRSQGYSRVANIERKNANQDGQKNSLLFFEYDVDIHGEIHAPTLDAKIYLAHLYSAQKRYEKANQVLKTIILSEDTSTITSKLFEALIHSAENLKDDSPNACSIRLKSYFLFTKIFPHRDFPLKDILKIYETYLSGQDNLEHVLILTKAEELDLIDFLESKETINEELINRRNFLKNELATITTMQVHYYEDNEERKKYYLEPSFYFCLPVNEKKENQGYFENKDYRDYKKYWIESLFESDFKDFLGTFEEFSNYYNKLNGCDSTSPLVQGFFYEYLTREDTYPEDHKKFTNDRRLVFLLLLAYLPGYFDSLPPKDASYDQKLSWYEQFEKQYLSDKNRLEKLGRRFPNVFPKKTSITHSLKTFAEQEPNKPLGLYPNILKNWDLDLAKASGFDPFSIRDRETYFSSLQGSYLTAISDINKPSTVFLEEQISPLELRKSEQKYASNIEERISNYKQDCRAAFEQSKQKMVLKKDADFSTFLRQIQEEQAISLEHQEKLKESLLTLANKAPFEFPHYVHHQAATLGRAKKTHHLETILRAAAQKNGTEVLKRLNPYLSEKEAEEVLKASLEFMTEATHCDHLKRISDPLEKWLRNPEKMEEFEKAQEALSEARNYKLVVENTPLLLFEYLSKIRIRKKQADLVRLVISALLESQDEKLSGKAFQLIMAGGKTSVIISILAEMLSETGMLSFILADPSQFSSLKGNLSTYQSKRFGKNIYVLDYTLQDLGKVDCLDVIIKRLEEAHTKKCAVMMKASLPQIIQSKFIIMACQNSKSKKEEEILLKLQKINQIFIEKGVGFFDEGDMLLSLLVDVNIPIGKQNNIKPERAALVKKIFEILIRPELKNLFDFRNNPPTELSEKDYEEKVLLFLSDEIFSYSALRLKYSPEFKNAFVRYACDLISDKDQLLADDENEDLSLLSVERQENIAFLRKLKAFLGSSDKYEREAAQLIAITRGIFTSVLRVSLSSSNNRDFGRKKTNDDGEIVPYEGAQTPSKRKLANIYLNLAFHYQCALEGGISKEEILFLAQKMTEAANHYAKKDKVNFDETLEAKQFQKLTNVALHEISKREVLESAWKFVNDPEHPKRLLDLEAEVAPLHVQYYTKKIKSNAINRTSQFRKKMACSGTLWNWLTFHRGFGKAALDSGTEGSILNLLSKKIDAKAVHEVDRSHLDSVLNIIKTHPQKNKIRAIVDGGAFLKDHDNHEVAKKLLDLFECEKEKGGPQIDAVLFLHKFSEQEIKEGHPKECFVLLKADEKHFLKNTTNEEFLRHGIKVENLFMLFDEMRITGTDVELDDNAIFLSTIDKKMPMSIYLQQSLRARKIFKKQQCEIVVTTKARQEMVNQGKSFDDLTLTFAKNEAKILKDQIDRARLSQIEDIVRSAVIKELLAAKTTSEISKIAKKYEGFLFDFYEDEPFKQYGRIQGQEPVCIVLEKYAKELLESFEKTNSPYYSEAKKEIEELLVHYKQTIPADETMDPTQKSDLGCSLEIEIEDEVQLALEEEQNIELNVELLNLLNTLTSKNFPQPFIEEPWAISKELPLTIQLQPRLSSLREHLSQSVNFPVDFFPDNLLLTKNFLMTETQELPLYHPHTKKAGFLLVTEKETGTFDYILISEKEAAYFKNWLKENPINNAFLIDLQGIPEVNVSLFDQQSPKFQEELRRSLWYANLFNGDIDFLEKHEDLSKELIADKRGSIEKYLQLKLAHQEKQLRKLFSCDLFDLQSNLAQSQLNGILFSDRRKYNQNRYNTLRRLGKEAVSTLDPKLVEDLTSQQVQWLTTSEQINSLSDTQINDLIPTQIHLLDRAKIPLLTQPEHIKAIRKSEQMAKLTKPQLEHIEPEQIEFFPDERLAEIPLQIIHGLKDKQQIQRFSGPLVQKICEAQINLINKKDASFLLEHQIPWLRERELVQEVSSEKIHLIKKEYRTFINKFELLLELPDDEGFDDIQKKWLCDYLSSNFKENHLKTWHLKYLSGTALNSILNLDIIRQLNAKQAHFLNDDALQFISPKIVDQLDSSDIRRITKPKLLLKLSDAQLEKIDENQKSILTHAYDGIGSKEEFSYIFNLGLIAERHLQFLPYQMTSFIEPEHIFNLKEKHWHYLNKNQVQGAANGAKEKISKTFVSCLCLNALEGLSEDFSHLLDVPTISRLTQGHVRLIQGLNGKQLSKILDKPLQEIKASQIPLLETEDFKRLEKPELLMTKEAAARSAELTFKQKKILSLAIAKLKGEEIPVYCLGYATKNQIESLNDKNKIKVLPKEQLKFIKKEQLANFGLKDFSKDFIRTLNNNAITILNKPELSSLIQYLTEDHLKNLDPFQFNMIHKLSVTQLQKVKDDVVQEIDRKQAQNLGNNDLFRLSKAELIHELNSKQLSQLNDRAIQKIKPSQLKTIEKKDFQRLTNPDLLISNESTIHKSLLTQNQKAILTSHVPTLESDLVPIHCLEFISEKQVRDLKDKSKIQALPLDKVPFLKKEQLLGFRKEDFSKDFISKLNDGAIAILNDPELCELAKFLTDFHLQNLDKAYIYIIESLTKEQLAKTNNSAIQNIKASQLVDILPEDFKRILNTSLLMTPEAAPYKELLTEEQRNILIPFVQTLSVDQVPLHYLDLISDIQVLNLVDKNKIKALLSEKVTLLKGEQLSTFAEEDFSSDFIQHLNFEAIKILNSQALCSLSTHLEEKQIKALDTTQKNIISHLSADQLHYVSDESLQEIDASQVQGLKETELNRLRKQELLLNISQGQVNSLNETCLKRLKKAANHTRYNTLQPFQRKLLPKWKYYLKKVVK